VNDVENLESKKEGNTFESRLLDLRAVNLKFNDNFKVEKFGMLKVNDSVFSFVFKLNEETTNEEVQKFSIGIVGYDSNLKDPYKASFSPDIEKIDGNKYLIMTRKINQTRYFDSLEVYTYARKNWEATGRINSIKLEDILFEEK
jgi:hypothetical protein